MAKPILGNRTRLPDDVLEHVLSYASRRMGIKERVQVRVANSAYVQGEYLPYGAIKLRLPVSGFGAQRNYKEVDGQRDYTEILLGRAQAVVELILHEFAHARQWQDGCGEDLQRKGWTASHSRRVAHRYRPVENDARDKVDKALKMTQAQQARFDDVVLELASALEQALWG